MIPREMNVRDRIIIRGLRARCIIGVHEWERRAPQEVVINLALSTDLRAAGRSDALADAIDYQALTLAVTAAVESSSYLLLEALAEEIARIAVVEHGAMKVVVRVDKPGALRFTEAVGVEIERERADFN